MNAFSTATPVLASPLCHRPQSRSNQRLAHGAPGAKCQSRQVQSRAALAQAEGKLVDYYELLNVDDAASLEEIKASYRYMARECHPDYLGDAGHDLCVLLNEAYSVLSDTQQRQRYNAQLQQQLEDDLDDYTGEPLSKWLVNHRMGKAKDLAETRAVFVDEFECIGCKQCVWCASGTFRIEPDYGRSRVFAQWIENEDTIQDAIDSCPVSCIHWVQKAELPALEYVMQKRMGRCNVGIMMAGQGTSRGDVWAATDRFLKERAQKLAQRAAAAKHSPTQEAARAAAADQIRRQAGGGGWWGGFADTMAGAFSGAMSAAGSHVGPGPGNDGTEVGRRRRRRQPPLTDGQGTIPLERSLVPFRTQEHA